MYLNETLRPQLNPEKAYYRQYTYYVEGGTNVEFIGRVLSENEVSPESHKQALDLCSGDGSVAAILTVHGWKPENITCIDLYKSPTPLVSGVNWRYFNISGLIMDLNLSHEIPGSILRLKSSFDLVTLFQGHLGGEIERAACNFFVKPRGFVLCP